MRCPVSMSMLSNVTFEALPGIFATTAPAAEERDGFDAGERRRSVVPGGDASVALAAAASYAACQDCPGAIAPAGGGGGVAEHAAVEAFSGAAPDLLLAASYASTPSAYDVPHERPDTVYVLEAVVPTRTPPL